MSTESFCFVNTVEDAYKLISDYETKNTIKFACYKSKKQFGNTGKKLNGISNISQYGRCKIDISILVPKWFPYIYLLLNHCAR